MLLIAVGCVHLVGCVEAGGAAFGLAQALTQTDSYSPRVGTEEDDDGDLKPSQRRLKERAIEVHGMKVDARVRAFASNASQTLR